MAPKSLPSPEVLRQLLRYEPETGRLFWLQRPVGMFASTAIAAAWNTRYAGKAAFTSKNGCGYMAGSVMRQSHKAHRVAWALHYGAWPSNEIDHINGDKTDNQISNLRLATRSQNQHNRPALASSQSGVKGVDRRPGDKNWRAQIMVNGRKIHLGYFPSVEKAAAAYAKASAELHGSFGRV